MFFTKEDKNLSMLERMLKISNLWFYYDASPRTKNIQKVIGYLFQFINIVAQLSVFKVGFKKLYLESSVGTYYTGMMIIHLELIVFFKNINILNQFIYGMKKILNKRIQAWEVQIFDQFCSKSWKFINFNWKVLVMFWLIFVIFPTVYDLILLVFYESLEPFFAINFFEAYLSTLKERSLYLYIALFCTYCEVCLGGLHSICLVCILPSTVAYMCAELRVISRRMELWSKDHKIPHRDLVLRQIIQEHKDILGLIHLMKKYIGELFISHNIILPLSITLSMFSLSKALKDGNMDLAIQHSYILCGWISFNFIPCYFSQNLYDESVRFSETLYKIDWHKETPRVRRNLLLMMVVTKKPIILNYKGIIPMNLQRFREIMNTTYSYFMLLQSTV